MDISKFFKAAIDQDASDVHLVAGSPPSLRVSGDLVKIANGPLNNKALTEATKALVVKDVWERFLEERELDFSHEFYNARFRVNLHFQEGKIGLTARLIPEAVPDQDFMMFSEVIYNMTHMKDGLILVTGPSGSGKSTTLAGMIDIINRERRSHIVTIEDPIEYIFKENQSIIEQRELGTDTHSFALALKYALRQDPNVIMVGEMRDVETIQAALTAAETGHLVLSTLHTAVATDTISRIVDVFPSHQQQQILNQLAAILRSVIAQQLIPRVDGGLVVAREIMINNSAVSNLIKRNQVGQLNSTIQTHQKEGMITMNKEIQRLAKEGIVDEQVAKARMRDMDTKAVYY